MGRRVGPKLTLVAGGRDHVPLANHGGADRHVIVRGGTPRLVQRNPHETLVGGA